MATIDDIWLFLSALEDAVLLMPRGGLDYETAQELYAALDALSVLVEDQFLCAAPDYPHEADDAD